MATPGTYRVRNGDSGVISKLNDVSSTAAGQVCLAQVLSSSSEVPDLSDVALRFPRVPGSMLDPRFFLASVNEKVWIPRIVVVSRADTTIGIVYAKERKLGVFATGILYADATLNAMVIADPDDREQVFQVAVAALMKRRGVRGLRLLVPPDGFEIPSIGKMVSGGSPIDVDRVEVENHCYLRLTPDYNSFLDGLGSNTRRNFRYYRRRFEGAGHQYVPTMTLAEFANGAAVLAKKSVTGADRDGVKRALDMFSVVNLPWLAGLRHRDGQLLSIAGGWYEPGEATLFLQMNDDRDHKESSLSSVMRGYVIENLIAERIPILRFWAGVGGALFRYRVPVPAVKVYLDKRGIVWHATRFLLPSIAPLFPKRMAWVADWIARGVR